MPKYQNVLIAWKKQTKNGDTYLSVKAERDIKAGENINLFANDKGDNPNRPDYRAYEKVEEPQQEVNLDEIPL